MTFMAFAHAPEAGQLPHRKTTQVSLTFIARGTQYQSLFELAVDLNRSVAFFVQESMGCSRYLEFYAELELDESGGLEIFDEWRGRRFHRFMDSFLLLGVTAWHVRAERDVEANLAILEREVLDWLRANP